MRMAFIRSSRGGTTGTKISSTSLQRTPSRNWYSTSPLVAVVAIYLYEGSLQVSCSRLKVFINVESSKTVIIF